MDDDGYITYTEFYSVLKTLNKHFTETQLQESFNNLSTNSKISFDTFINIMEHSTPANDFTEEDLICAFNVFDVHNNGYITVKDLHIIMKSIFEAKPPHWHQNCGRLSVKAGPIDFVFISLTVLTVVIAIICTLLM